MIVINLLYHGWNISNKSFIVKLLNIKEKIKIFLFDIVSCERIAMVWFKRLFPRLIPCSGQQIFIGSLDYANNLVDRTINRKRHSEMGWIISIHQDSELIRGYKPGCLTLSRGNQNLYLNNNIV